MVFIKNTKATWVFSPGSICAIKNKNKNKNRLATFLTKDWQGSGGRANESIAGKKSGSCRAK